MSRVRLISYYLDHENIKVYCKLTTLVFPFFNERHLERERGGGLRWSYLDPQSSEVCCKLPSVFFCNERHYLRKID